MSNSLKKLAKLLHPGFQKLILDYKVEFKPRYGHGKPPHGMMYDLINSNRTSYSHFINSILQNQEYLHQISFEKNEKNEDEPYWNNGFLPGLDISSLYTMISQNKPKQYIEIGSGNSTMVARKAIKDHKLDTQIISIDPFPRASIDHLADKVIRKPFEKLEDLNFITEGLEAGDILFIDNSHRCLPNSDATVFFLELLPMLKKGVIVHIHDIYLPYDYPQFMCDRFYSEQYMLAAFILANHAKYNTIFPAYFVSEDKELSEQLLPLWNHSELMKAEKHGGSYWLQIEQ